MERKDPDNTQYRTFYPPSMAKVVNRLRSLDGEDLINEYAACKFATQIEKLSDDPTERERMISTMREGLVKYYASSHPDGRKAIRLGVREIDTDDEEQAAAGIKSLDHLRDKTKYQLRLTQRGLVTYIEKLLRQR